MNNQLSKYTLTAALILTLGGGIAGCKQEGPAETTGKKLDEVTTDIGNAVEDKCEEAKKAAGAEDTRC